jgi:hypothetical protein
MVDMVVARKELRETLARIIGLLMKTGNGNGKRKNGNGKKNGNHKANGKSMPAAKSSGDPSAKQALAQVRAARKAIRTLSRTVTVSSGRKKKRARSKTSS